MEILPPVTVSFSGEDEAVDLERAVREHQRQVACGLDDGRVVGAGEVVVVPVAAVHDGDAVSEAIPHIGRETEPLFQALKGLEAGRGAGPRLKSERNMLISRCGWRGERGFRTRLCHV